MPDNKSLVPVERIESRILIIRGHKVLLDVDLSELYGTETKMLVRAVKRNFNRFPSDFMFRLSKEEFHDLRRQFGTSSQWGGRRYSPYAFTEHGAVMVASVLNTERAIEASIYVVRAFIKLRQVLSSQRKLAQKLAELEQRLDSHDESIRAIITAIKELMEPPVKESRKRIGFKTPAKLLKIKGKSKIFLFK